MKRVFLSKVVRVLHIDFSEGLSSNFNVVFLELNDILSYSATICLFVFNLVAELVKELSVKNNMIKKMAGEIDTLTRVKSKYLMIINV